MQNPSGKLVRLSGATAFHSFTAAFLLTALLEIPAGVLFLLSLVASLLALPSAWRHVFARPAPYLKKYLGVIVVFNLFVLVYAAFGRVGPEGWGIFLELALTFVIGLAIVQHLETSGRSIMETVVRVSLIHGTLMIVVAFVQYSLAFHLYGDRVGGAINPIIYAHLMLTSVGIVAVWLFTRLQTAATPQNAGLLALWLVAAFAATYFTGSRGAILVFVPLVGGLIVLFFLDNRKVGTGTILGAAALFAGILVAIVMSARFQQGYAELVEAFNGHTGNGNVGVRLQFWAQALTMIKAHPLAGNGLRFFHEISGLPADSPLQIHNHAHNQFLDMWMKAGLAGVFLFVSLHTLPVLAGIRVLRAKGDSLLGYSLIWLSGAYLVFGLTDIFITRLGTMTIYSLYMVLLLRQADNRLGSTP